MIEKLKSHIRSPLKKTLISYFFILSASASILLFPSITNFSVFSKGEYSYTESIGILFLFLIFGLIPLHIILNKISSLKINKKIYYSCYALIVLSSVLILLFVISLLWIRYEVKSTCVSAKRQYGGDCIDALGKMLDDKGQSYRARNRAVYALGQLAEERSLTTLTKYYTGKIPERESLHKGLSQYELKKAIKWSVDGNITSWMYFDAPDW